MGLRGDVPKTPISASAQVLDSPHPDLVKSSVPKTFDFGTPEARA
jgi:hypothetical protein